MNHICGANMILKGACTNPLKGKFSRTFWEKVGGAAARMRCRTHSVRYFQNTKKIFKNPLTEFDKYGKI